MSHSRLICLLAVVAGAIASRGVLADASCVYGRVLDQQFVTVDGGSGAVLVELTSGDLAACAPVFTSPADWITYVDTTVIDRPPDPFVYHGYSVQYAVAANTGPARSASYQVAGHSIEVTQPGAPPQPDYRVTVKEYYHAQWNHYFITADPYEQSLLGLPPFADWQPTGRTFVAYTNYPTGIHAPVTGPETPVCRFFNDSFAPKSSHFYGLPDVCDQVTQFFPDWQLETKYAFRMGVPSVDGVCPVATPVPIYRLYNNGQGGAPNHRFVASLGDRAAMMAQGWIPEGYGPMGLGFCGPAGS